MKRLLALIVALVMVFSLAACGSGAGENSENPGGNENSASPNNSDSGSVDNQGTSGTTGTDETKDFEFPADIPAKKIGVVGVFTGNELYIQWKSNLSSMGEKFNVEFQFVDQNDLGGDTTSAIENLCTAGVDGILMQGTSESILEILDRYNVPMASYCQTYPQDQMDLFASYNSFLGLITEDDTVSAAHAAEAMYEAGCRNVAIAGLQRGLAQIMDDRADYFKARFEELGGTIIAEDYSLMQFANSISSFAAAYPQMDGIFSTILNESVFQTFTTEGLAGQVKIAGFDMSDSCDAFFKSGDLVFAATGQQATILTAFAVLYNDMYDGTRLIPDSSKMVSRNFIEIHNAQECQDYNDYIRFSTCYSPEELGYMIVGFNPKYTFEDFEAMHMAFSIEDVKSRTLA